MLCVHLQSDGEREKRLSGRAHDAATRINPILNVLDIRQSFDWFEKLGWVKSRHNSLAQLGNTTEYTATECHANRAVAGVSVYLDRFLLEKDCDWSRAPTRSASSAAL